MNNLFTASKQWQTGLLTAVRLIVGIFMIYRGKEIFSAEKMQAYMTWDQFKLSSIAQTAVYAGKGAELLTGILLFLGLFTRLGAALLALTMGYISFFVGKGIIWYDDQHPFLFVLLALVFVALGGGPFSLDRYLLNRQ